jgi:Na+/proline symporter
MKDSRKWARLFVCLAFHMILTGLASAILNHIFGVARPGKILFLPSLAAAAVVGVFYTWDREGSRVAEAGNLAGALVAFHLWADLTYPPEGAGPWAVLSGWPVWGSYLANTLAILAAGWLAERRRG